jgi:hypothetical protein
MARLRKEENNRCSEELATSLGIQRNKKSHKLEEDRSMYDESKDEDDLEDIFEDPNAEDLGDLELQEMKNQIGNIEKKINQANEKLGLTRKNI